MRIRPATLAVLVVLSLAAAPVSRAGEALAPEVRAAIDAAVPEVLARTGAPSASIAVVKDGRIAYVQAYGLADVDARTPATPAMRYSIGSISKQFTATALLLLAEEGRLSLDDPVSRFVP
ncbi:MAG TPA: serine hydrolase domain-containing protein, partial [Vicinamibacteria bacterium]|nr:serine hydrolase domain-containing protein [Vicinamibacteria bacterium]